MAWSTKNVKRTYACNPEILIYWRERRGWTQRQLAGHAGYSDRLISKAESGRTISSHTVEVLAESLSIAEEPVYPEDLICDPVACAKEFVRASYKHQSRAIDAIRHFLAEDVVMRMAGDPSAIPFAGEFRGLAEAQRMFDIFFSILESPDGHDPDPHYRFIGQGNEVFCWGESWIHPIGSPMDEPIGVNHRFVFRQGKLVLFEDRFDTQAGEKHLRNNSKPPIDGEA